MIEEIQKELTLHAIDGWLLYDFHARNPHAMRLLNLPESAHITRRYFYFIPKKGKPVKIYNPIDGERLSHLEGEERLYRTWQEMEEALEEVLKNVDSVAMEYSPLNAVPTISVVDGGTIEMIRHHGVDVVSSGPFLQKFTCTLSDQQFASHRAAADVLDRTVMQTWDLLRTKRGLTEKEVQTFMVEKMQKAGCLVENPPIVAFGKNGADPHHIPGETKAEEGDLVLLDLWTKQPGGIFADITRMGVLAAQPTARQLEIFEILKEAQRAAIDFIRRRFEKGEIVKGFEADEICRDLIKEKGYGAYFGHRTGHNIYTEDHGPGTNLDSIESLDERPFIPRTCFSVEPGIYIPGELGMRLETDVYIHPNGEIEVTAGLQEHLEYLR